MKNALIANTVRNFAMELPCCFQHGLFLFCVKFIDIQIYICYNLQLT